MTPVFFIVPVFVCKKVCMSRLGGLRSKAAGRSLSVVYGSGLYRRLQRLRLNWRKCQYPRFPSTVDWMYVLNSNVVGTSGTTNARWPVRYGRSTIKDHGNRVFYDRRASDVNCNAVEWRNETHRAGEKKGGLLIIKAER